MFTAIGRHLKDIAFYFIDPIYALVRQTPWTILTGGYFVIKLLERLVILNIRTEL